MKDSGTTKILSSEAIVIKKEIQKTLLSMGEEGYRDFSSSLMPTIPKERVIGVRIPILRRYAKSLKDYEQFLSDLPHTYFEEDNLHAFLIERETDFEKCIEKLNAFLPFVDNWATCDSMKPKVLKSDLQKLYLHIKKWLRSKDVYAVRYGINLLMSFYLDDAFQREHFSLVAKVKSGEYYINMMRAWYFAEALNKRYDEALAFIKENNLDTWTHNKAIQKATESRKISENTKKHLKTLKR